MVTPPPTDTRKPAVRASSKFFSLAGLSAAFSDGSNDVDGSADNDDDDNEDQKAVEEAAVERQRVTDMAQQEAKNVQRWKRNVLVIMFVTGVLLTIVTYMFLKREQEEDFETSVRAICV